MLIGFITSKTVYVLVETTGEDFALCKTFHVINVGKGVIHRDIKGANILATKEVSYL